MTHKKAKEDCLTLILKDLSEGKISADHAEQQILDLFSGIGSSFPDDFWKQEYNEAVKEISNLQDELKDAESAIRDMESELRSRY